ncbi:MAG: hypothetical protein WBG86_03530 [Polyangiales bacterium]
MKVRFAFLLVMVGSIATVGSCSNRPLNVLNPCTINGVVQNVPVNPQRALDVLFIIDDSPSMADEQDKLAEQVPRLVNLLLTGGIDVDSSMPVGEFPAVESRHVGIVTPDLGYSTDPPTPNEPPTLVGTNFQPDDACDSPTGKAGVMQVTGSRPMCSAQTAPEGTMYLNFPEQGFTQQEFISDVECVTGQTNGCGFEQQLEAVLAQNRVSANAGFSRQDALLAIILITDEDDCSTTDPRVFDTEARSESLNPLQGPLTTEGTLQFNLRCAEHAEALQEIQRYVDGIAALKEDPSQVVFAAITGIPEKESLDRDNFETDAERYAAILADADMEEVPDPAQDNQVSQQLTPACTATDGSGAAVPGRRIVDVARGLAEGSTGVGTVVESICAADYSPALNAIVERIAAALRQLCLPRPLNRNAENQVGCEVREVQPEGVTCTDAGRGREPEPVGNEDGREVCRITQLSANADIGTPDGLGWFYDDFTSETVAACSFNDEQQRVSFTSGSEPVSGARIRFECLQAAPPSEIDIGWPCDVADTSSCDRCTNDPRPRCGPELDDEVDCCDAATELSLQYDRDDLTLACSADNNTCQLSCENNTQCPGGFSCFDSSGDGVSYCINPTCTLN